MLNKKAQIMNIFWIILLPTVIVMGVIFYFFIYNVNHSLELGLSDSIAGATEVKSIATQNNAKTPSFLDFTCVLVFFGIASIIFFGCWYLSNSSLFLPIFLGVSIFILIASVWVLDGASKFLTSSAMSDYSTMLPMSMFIINNGFIIEILLFFGILIAAFSKKKSDNYDN